MVEDGVSIEPRRAYRNAAIDGGEMMLWVINRRGTWPEAWRLYPAEQTRAPLPARLNSRPRHSDLMSLQSSMLSLARAPCR